VYKICTDPDMTNNTKTHGETYIQIYIVIKCIARKITLFYFKQAWNTDSGVSKTNIHISKAK